MKKILLIVLQVILILIKKQQKRNIIYVDEGVTQSRDKILYNILSKKIGDGKIFLKDLNQLFNFLEKNLN